MIIFFSDGRLGNQIFQYAFLKTIAGHSEKIITTDMNKFLEVFECNDSHFKNYRVGKYKRFFIKRVIKKVLYLFSKAKLISYVRQDRNKISSLPSFTEKKGIFPLRFVETNFFQSEKFFDCESVDLKIKESYIVEAKNILSKIDNCYIKVFIHVRRGDYLSETYLDQKGINLPKTYFTNAINKIQKEVKNPYIIFLSDDPEFVECCFDDIKNKYISKNSMGIDLALMTLCEYGVVSNSSFSWWGAYLMQSRKKVFFPKYWYGWKSKVESHVKIQPSWAEVIEVDK